LEGGVAKSNRKIDPTTKISCAGKLPLFSKKFNFDYLRLAKFLWVGILRREKIVIQNKEKSAAPMRRLMAFRF
jgi:hypothetical protein